MDAEAASFEPTKDLYVHEAIYGTTPAHTVIKGGRIVDGGSYGGMIGWGPAENFGGSIVNARLEMTPSNTEVDGAFTVHQMITSWDESTDWGSTHPLPGVDYNPHPIGMIGNSDANTVANRRDRTEISHIVDYWAGGGANNGLWLQPLGIDNNANYSSNPGYGGGANLEFQWQSRENTAGLDSNDTWIETNIGTHSFLSNYIEPISDTTLNQALPDNLHRNDLPTITGGVNGGDLSIPLLRWGLGEISLANPAQAALHRVTTARMKVQSVSSTTVGFSVHRILTPWDENTATWNQFGAGGPQAGIDYVALSLGAITVDNSNTATELDITDTMNFWLANPDQNHGVVLIPDVQTGTLSAGIVDARRVFGMDGGAPGDDTWIFFDGVTIIPEPGTIALLGLGALLLWRRTRRG